MIQYSNLGSDKQLNEIVIAGSHDAGITSGGGNAQTQNLDIRAQAAAGIRMFDLRVAAFSTGAKTGGVKEVGLHAFHADGSLQTKETKTRYVTDQDRVQDVTRVKLKYGQGAIGEGLGKMLADARGFVETYSSEFLILKFDKCSDWRLIAETCVDGLGDTIYTDGGNLNKKTLRDLAGKVIVVVTDMSEIPVGYRGAGGILNIKNLYGKNGPSGGYQEDYQGLQYFGKGGTSVNPKKMKWTQSGKIKENVEKQTVILDRKGDGNPDVMGMMYWTSTGLLENIKDRNKEMWKPKKVAALNRMWKSGLEDSINSRLTQAIDPTSYSSGGLLKAFMPNIVMIDFADPSKCQTIYELNFIAATSIIDATRDSLS